MILNRFKLIKYELKNMSNIILLINYFCLSFKKSNRFIEYSWLSHFLWQRGIIWWMKSMRMKSPAPQYRNISEQFSICPVDQCSFDLTKNRFRLFSKLSHLKYADSTQFYYRKERSICCLKEKQLPNHRNLE